MADGKRHTVDLTLHLQAATVQVDPNKGWSPARHTTQTLSLVVVTEVACVDAESKVDCFEANTALSWSLLTSLPIDQVDDVQRIVRFYARRWRIVGEAFPQGTMGHFMLKSRALNVEQRQFDDVHTLYQFSKFRLHNLHLQSPSLQLGRGVWGEGQV